MSGSFYSERTVTARKEHRCDDCHRTINPGVTYLRIAGASYGDFWTWKDCRHCAVYRQAVAIIDEDSYYDEDGFNLRDWTDNYGTAADIAYLVKNPIKALGYYRIARWFMDRWQTRDGQMRPVPVLP